MRRTGREAERWMVRSRKAVMFKQQENSVQK